MNHMQQINPNKACWCDSTIIESNKHTTMQLNQVHHQSKLTNPSQMLLTILKYGGPHYDIEYIVQK